MPARLPIRAVIAGVDGAISVAIALGISFLLEYLNDTIRLPSEVLPVLHVGLVGVILAYCHVFFLSAPLFEPVLKGWSVLYPRFTLVPAVDAYQLGVLFSLTVAPYTIATIIPCWHAATVDPDAAMRS